MKTKNVFHWSLICIISLYGCNILQKTARNEFVDETYQLQKQPEKVYVDVEDDTIQIHQLKPIKKNVWSFPIQSVEKPQNVSELNLKKNSFDIDFLTIPLKYRAAVANVPAQFNTTFNGAVYLGYRNDYYKLNYTASPLGMYNRQINHFGISYGIFSGLGNGAITPTTTQNKQDSEYDGVVWSNGIATIVAINKFTLGLTLGIDRLLDPNSNNWIYQNKLWLGLGFGLNLN